MERPELRRNLQSRLFIEGAWIRVNLYLHARVQLFILNRIMGLILD